MAGKIGGKHVRRPLRIVPAFEDRDVVRALFDQHGPYPSAARYLPDGSDESDARPTDGVLPWFRGTWALDGEPLVAGVAPILHHKRFVTAACELFETERIVPRTVVVNINAPMQAGVRHVDVPSFRGATRATLPLRLLIAMGASGLFERWRVVEAGALAWFYTGVGGSFDYWPDGLGAAMQSECSPFGNVAVLADNNRMYHRIGAIGSPDAKPPRMTEHAQIRPAGDGWQIEEAGEIRARYPADAIRLSILWKAEVHWDDDDTSALGAEQIVSTLADDLERRGISTAPDLHDPTWIAMVYRTYTRPA
jgi:hypothetical protein